MKTVTYTGPAAALVVAGKRYPKGVPVDASNDDAAKAEKATLPERIAVQDSPGKDEQ